MRIKVTRFFFSSLFYWSVWFPAGQADRAYMSRYTELQPRGHMAFWLRVHNAEVVKLMLQTFMIGNKKNLNDSRLFISNSDCLAFKSLFSPFLIEQIKASAALVWHSCWSKLQVMVAFSWMLGTILILTKEGCRKCCRISHTGFAPFHSLIPTPPSQDFAFHSSVTKWFFKQWNSKTSFVWWLCDTSYLQQIKMSCNRLLLLNLASH